MNRVQLCPYLSTILGSLVHITAAGDDDILGKHHAYLTAAGVTHRPEDLFFVFDGKVPGIASLKVPGAKGDDVVLI